MGGGLLSSFCVSFIFVFLTYERTKICNKKQQGRTNRGRTDLVAHLRYLKSEYHSGGYNARLRRLVLRLHSCYASQGAARTSRYSLNNGINAEHGNKTGNEIHIKLYLMSLLFRAHLLYKSGQMFTNIRIPLLTGKIAIYIYI